MIDMHTLVNSSCDNDIRFCDSLANAIQLSVHFGMFENVQTTFIRKANCAPTSIKQN